MEFANELNKLGRMGTPFGDFGFLRNHIELKNGMKLSVQGSVGHYSRPRKSLEDAKDYEAMEVCLISENEEVLAIEEVVKDETIQQEISLYNQYNVYNYVPMELIESIYLELK